MEGGGGGGGGGGGRGKLRKQGKIMNRTELHSNRTDDAPHTNQINTAKHFQTCQVSSLTHFKPVSLMTVQKFSISSMESHSFSTKFLIHAAYHFILLLCKISLISKARP